ncbi:DUF975 family protein [Caproiciproducens faecalis]|uniref:DUF975 family protein n=1 Tax=Caproiciproducens faecalis TaxID=2820301 RepID=A0ABS7DPT7_9FIRM|nr:DUF975 family protein [Caproiciproducens faecalis]MBW7572825.1 DUF975 family protein [Caproiciproducens faecalis]
MWDRGILKSNAKIALGGRYWAAFGVTLLAMVISGGYSWVTNRFTNTHRGVPWIPEFGAPANPINSGLVNLISLIGFLYFIFVGLPIVVGVARYFIRNHFGASDFNTMFSGFQYAYLRSIGAMLVTYIFVGLWYLLLIIPGIIKQLEYSMVPYLLADNPNIPGSRVREISRMMTNGEKGAIFVLGLSFIGWYLLGAICFGVGILFVNPYYEATMAELYIFLRDRAIQTNQLNPAELGLVPPAAPYPQNPPIL